ncbi:hypothetical protein [Lentibacillus amyloliquefaciens]|uniref:Uncharacterized protein n=1 Tax=Lentibacillus amyloliquefaciens TaxID=1472767 RepID=A0A0U4EAG7_9BACI|nr:hypothetical protein [Lentibacillus amyloliquefaciens]ALX50284.1 hypothetical protein AOX59_17890 [Lentibacillus amyloliquefaciens]
MLVALRGLTDTFVPAGVWSVFPALIWSLIEAEGSRLLRENGQLRSEQEAVFASEEAEALPAESDCPERKSILLRSCSWIFVKNNNPLEMSLYLQDFAG